MQGYLAHHCGTTKFPSVNFTSMVPRAKGQRRYLVCDTCYIDLHKAKMSVPQRKKYNLDAEQMLEQETAEEDDAESVEIAEDEE